MLNPMSFEFYELAKKHPSKREATSSMQTIVQDHHHNMHRNGRVPYTAEGSQNMVLPQVAGSITWVLQCTLISHF